ncbi:MAG TPA: dockerin, partial [Flavobacteriales bacterium]|nr:dockerin [Flavobacteriales bacterium]
MSKYYLVLILLLAMVSCRKEAPVPPGFELEDWTIDTHAGDATPNYDIVFPNDKVNRFDIVIEPEYWEVLQNNLNEVLGSGGFATETPTYVPSQVYFNGRQWYDVGFRFKGNSSLSSAYNTGKSKFPIRLEFNHFEDENPLIWGQSFYGFQQLSLANSFKDYSLMREKAADDVFREFGIPTAKAAFYRV